MKIPKIIEGSITKSYPSSTTRIMPEYDLFAALTSVACRARGNNIDPSNRISLPMFDCSKIKCEECAFGTEEGLLEAILHTLGEET